MSGLPGQGVVSAFCNTLSDTGRKNRPMSRPGANKLRVNV
uniref:Uncharacterized protein n=1 Tax=Morganella morganii TaxID=582 RepID=A0A6B7PXC3_MORMO|nr:hypothetical protein [Morganella morganii]QGJ79966.1 hypothetical protein [Morganella morganii]